VRLLPLAGYDAGSVPRPAPKGPSPAPERSRLLRGLARPPEAAARFLLGKWLIKQGLPPVRIVETEAYLGAGDPAAHAFSGLTQRNAPLWGPPGTLYVYLIYGMHHCLNFSVDQEGTAGCVLIRAAEPEPGSGLAAASCQGPGRLCRTLGLDLSDSGTRLFAPGCRLTLRDGKAPRIGVSARVGITKAADRPLRFYDLDSRAVSRGPRPLT
jgi:DNA-3-methyladenine glycosylase